MNLSHDGLTLRFDAPDAAAPERIVPYGEAATLTVGVEPPHPGNSVDVRYRVDGGPTRTLMARETRTDYARGVQYFVARFPRDLLGQKVEYCPVAHCAGRQVPRYGREDDMLASFLLAKQEPTAHAAPSHSPLVPRFTPELKLLGQLTVKLKPPTIFGKTPIGFRIDYYAQSGTIVGNGFRWTVVEDSADYMIVRPDGVGMVNVHATLKTEDGALISAAYAGTIEFGVDGYDRMPAGPWPERPKVQVSPRLVTDDSRYLWVNRTHFLGVGQVDMEALVFKYDVYGVQTGVELGAWAPA